jgi:hypothetical protein
MLQRLFANWVYGGFLAGFLILGLLVAFGSGWSAAFWITALQLPIYMIHKYEEQKGERFRIFVKEVIGHGREALSFQAVFVIIVFGV